MVSSVSGEKNRPISFHQQVAVDASSGAVAGLICFFFEGLKKRLQRGEIAKSDFFNLNNGKVLRVLHPREAFRGATAFSMAVALNSAVGLTFTKYLRSHPLYNDSEQHQMSTAILGGMLGACVASTPVENTIVVQQESGKGPLAAWEHMLKQGVSRPLVGVRELMVREAGFIGSVMYFGPKTREVVVEKTHNQALGTLATIGVGAAGSLLTHPFDTVATWRQKQEGKASISGACQELYRRGGVKAFYRGSWARIALFSGCLLTLDYLPSRINKWVAQRYES